MCNKHAGRSLFQTGDDILKKRTERFSTPVSATSATVVSQPVCTVLLCVTDPCACV